MFFPLLCTFSPLSLSLPFFLPLSCLDVLTTFRFVLSIYLSMPSSRLRLAQESKPEVSIPSLSIDRSSFSPPYLPSLRPILASSATHINTERHKKNHPHSHTQTLTHRLTDTHTHTHTLTHTYSLTHSLTHPLTHSHTHSLSFPAVCTEHRPAGPRYPHTQD
jgi:hypothetical protein